MLFAVTGTPGTGKTTACLELKRRGYEVIHLGETAERFGLLLGEGEDNIVDLQRLNEFVKSHNKDYVFLDGHYSHLLDVDLIIVLRCNPDTIIERLKRMSWDDSKIRENAEAEAVDVILIEALETEKPTYEIDCTNLRPEEVASDILSIVGNNRKEFKPGNVDWSEVILGWY